MKSERSGKVVRESRYRQRKEAGGYKAEEETSQVTGSWRAGQRCLCSPSSQKTGPHNGGTQKEGALV